MGASQDNDGLLPPQKLCIMRLIAYRPLVSEESHVLASSGTF